MKYRTATQWGIYDVVVENDRIVDVLDLDLDPNPSPLGKALIDGVQHKARIARPAVRRGWLENSDRAKHRRGADEFVDLPWDEALDLAAKELHRVSNEYDNRAIFAGSYGWASAGRFNHAQSQLHRFINLIGGSTRAANTYSTAAAQVILPHVVLSWGQMELEQTTWGEIAAGAELVVAFGGLPMRNTQVAYGGITEHQSEPGLAHARAAGVEIVTVSPVRGDGDNQDRWISPRPGTDVALMLGCAYVLEAENLLDRAFLTSHCAGYEHFRKYLLGIGDGQPKTPSWASEICDVEAATIAELARTMATKRTFLTAAWSLQRAQHGEQPCWMLITLACMLGHVGRTGCGFGFGYGAEGFVGSDSRRFNWATLPKGRNPTGFHIPVARIADLLLHPGETIPYDGQEITYPDIKLIYWAGGNPFHHHQDLNRLIKGWRRPDTVIVNEPWWTPVAQWADIVFPATTQLERDDICASSHDPYAHVMERAIPPQNDARSDHAIFKGLAARFDVLDEFTEGRTEHEWLANMWERSQVTAAKQDIELPSFDEFWRERKFKLPEEPARVGWLSQFRADPNAHRLGTPSGKIELFSEVVNAFELEDCLGHASWLEPEERLGGKASDKFPLALLTPQPKYRLHSQFDHSAYADLGKLNGHEIVTLHPDTGCARGIVEGQTVRLYNERGACLAAANFDDQMRVDVVVLPTGAWYRPSDPSTAGSLELNGNPNVLTLDVGTSGLAQGCSANTCLVEIESYTA
ncbi:MAG: molybdopterin-dependent oxidoreductase [Pseudomonadales bacterium]|nr:molybdopterin-dependent oxidoreductase [Pseudomonadales bacterium]